MMWFNMILQIRTSTFRKCFQTHCAPPPRYVVFIEGLLHHTQDKLFSSYTGNNYKSSSWWAVTVNATGWLSLWKFLVCVLKLALLENVPPHIEQLNLMWSKCLASIWVFKFVVCAGLKLLWQILHWIAESEQSRVIVSIIPRKMFSYTCSPKRKQDFKLITLLRTIFMQSKLVFEQTQ